MSDESRRSVNRVVFVGNYVPRRCGIATFTTDVRSAVAAHGPECFAIAVNDCAEGYDYPAPVTFTIEQDDIATYRRAAQFINLHGTDVVSIQHEFGIFGGPAGSHILALARDLRTPIVTTLHTVLREPSDGQLRVLRQLATLSDRVVVMSRRGEQFLRDIYEIPADKIDFIHHGTPDMPFADPNFHKDKFGTAGRAVLMTFGLIGPGKGIANVIRALPRIRERVPTIVYHVVGATHPKLVREQGEAYREGLQELARELGVEDAVRFDNRFIEADELVELVGTADAYVTPYLNEAQITSGSLAWAVGAGKAVVSTPYWHAQELLADDRGVLVPFNDAGAIADAVIGLLEDEQRRHAMRKRAYELGRSMTWPYVGGQYVESFEQARRDRNRKPRAIAAAKELRGDSLPRIQLRHLRRMTDGTGLIQHAAASVPNYGEGYSIDDNARALILMMRLQELGELYTPEVEDLASRYLAFVLHAFNPERGRFRNFMSTERRWLEESGSPDSHARAIWALGTVAGRARRRDWQELAGRMLRAALPAVFGFDDPRSWAFALLGLNEYLHWFSGDRTAKQERDELAGRLVGLFEGHRRDGWQWFEDSLTYCNAQLCEALLVTGQAVASAQLESVGMKSLTWLVDVQLAGSDHLVPIGCAGFYARGGARARFDQQPIEAASTVSACLAAWRVSGDSTWHREARRAFEWFMGRNDLGIALCDPHNGACCDGLHPHGVSVNQGAESTLAYLLSLVEMRMAEAELTTASELHAPKQPPRDVVTPAPEQPPAQRGALALSD